MLIPGTMRIANFCNYKIESALASPGFCNKIPQIQWLKNKNKQMKKQKYIFSQLWRLEVQNQGNLSVYMRFSFVWICFCLIPSPAVITRGKGLVR